MGLRGLAVVMLFASAVAAAPPRDPGPVEIRNALWLATRGHRSLSKGDLQRAVRDFEAALELVPFLPEARVGLGHMAMRERRFEDALREYRLAEGGHEQMATTLSGMENERYVKAQDEILRLSDLRSQISTRQHRVETGLNRTGGSGFGGTPGGLVREGTKLDARIDELRRAEVPIEAAPRDVPAPLLFYEGNALFNLGRSEPAVAVWEDCARRDANFPLVHNNLAVAYWKLGRIADAQREVARAEALGFRVNPVFRTDLERAAKEQAGAVTSR